MPPRPVFNEKGEEIEPVAYFSVDKSKTFDFGNHHSAPPKALPVAQVPLLPVASAVTPDDEAAVIERAATVNVAALKKRRSSKRILDHALGMAING